MKPLAKYVLSVPERVVRSTSALAGGLVREIGNATLPAGVRRTRMYQTMVESTLRFLIQQVGKVEGAYPAEDQLAKNFLLRRTLGDGLDIAGIAAFSASPMWVLAALADISGTGRHLMDEITCSLKAEGLLDAGTKFETMDQMLDGLERTVGTLVTSLRFPPLEVAELRREWAALKEAAKSIPAPRRPRVEVVRGEWEKLQAEAAAQERSVFELSSLMALATVRALPGNLRWLSKVTKTATVQTGRFFGEGLLDHYRTTLGDIREAGFVEYWRNEFRPYLRAAALQWKKQG